MGDTVERINEHHHSSFRIGDRAVITQISNEHDYCQLEGFGQHCFVFDFLKLIKSGKSKTIIKLIEGKNMR